VLSDTLVLVVENEKRGGEGEKRDGAQCVCVNVYAHSATTERGLISLLFSLLLLLEHTRFFDRKKATAKRY